MESFDSGPLIMLGLMLLAGYLAHVTAPRIAVPRVTLLLVAGAVFGPSLLDVIPESADRWFPFVAHLALAMVGFLLGENFGGRTIKSHGKEVLAITAGEMLFAATIVFAAMVAVGASIELALVMAGIAPASAPAAIFETIRESGAEGPLTDTVLGVVAIDDALGVVLFSLLLVAAQTVSGEGAHLTELLQGLWEVFGAVAVGALVSLPMVWALVHTREGKPTLIEAGGFVLLCAGLASFLGVSYLLATMVLGAIVAHRGKGAVDPFHAIEGVREPFLAIFFILAGYRFEADKMATLGLIGIVYIAARSAGLFLGGKTAGRIAHAPREVQNRVGWCILPQAGVALGFALLVQERLPALGSDVLPLVIGTTVLFEILGPLVARWNLRAAGELRHKAASGGREGEA